jgi:bacterioferritin-associated ferredoxin
MSAADSNSKRTKRLRLTTCACADLTFEQIAQKVRASKKNWRETCRELGVGVTCTACLPDLHDHLRSTAKKRDKK